MAGEPTCPPSLSAHLLPRLLVDGTLYMYMKMEGGERKGGREGGGMDGSREGEREGARQQEGGRGGILYVPDINF